MIIIDIAYNDIVFYPKMIKIDLSAEITIDANTKDVYCNKEKIGSFVLETVPTGEKTRLVLHLIPENNTHLNAYWEEFNIWVKNNYGNLLIAFLY